MPWPGFLKAILPKRLVDVDAKILSNLEEIKLASDNSVSTSKQVIVNHGTIIINNGPAENLADKVIDNLDLDQLKSGDTILETSSDETLRKIDATFWAEGTQNRIASFDGVVPKKDMPIVESAIFIQALYDSGQRVDGYMRDISIRFGARGNMICHLYSAGYFDTLVLPLYRELVETDNPKVEEFNEVYEHIVTESPLAMFVNKHDTIEEICDQLTRKIKTNKEVGINYLNIHGIGSQNIQKIKRALCKEEMRQILVGDPVVDTKNGMANVTVYF